MTTTTTPALTLKHFILRQQVLRQYRSFFRVIRQLEDKQQREEIASLVRYDFKRNASLEISDANTIKSMLFHGEKMLKELKQSIDFTK